MCTSIWLTGQKKKISSVRALISTVGAGNIRWYPDLEPAEIQEILDDPDQCLCSVDIMATARANGVEASNEHDGDTMMYLWPENPTP